MTKRDDYLWDPSEEPDEEVAELERELAGARFRGDVPPAEALPERAVTPLHRFPIRRFVAAAALLLATLLVLREFLPDEGAEERGVESAYRLEVLRGAPRVDGEAVQGATPELRVGQRVVCDADTSARVEVGTIGDLVLEPDSALRVANPDSGAASEGAGYLLHLERGALSASIFAAPRLFQVGTPAGLAVDMGCMYRASVEDDGRTRLSVTAGLVAFETEVRRIVVPAGASAWADPRLGPSTPIWDDAPRAWHDAVERLDREPEGDDGALAVLLDADDERTISLVLWHLLDHPSTTVAGRVYERLAELAPPPADVDRSGVLGGDTLMRERWKDELSWSW